VADRSSNVAPFALALFNYVSLAQGAAAGPGRCFAVTGGARAPRRNLIAFTTVRSCVPPSSIALRTATSGQCWRNDEEDDEDDGATSIRRCRCVTFIRETERGYRLRARVR